MKRILLVSLTFSLFGFLNVAMANWSVRVTLKRPFLSSWEDSSGTHSDSLARFYQLRMTVFRSQAESLTSIDTTTDSGYATFTFTRWADSMPVDTNSISRVALSLPSAHKTVSVAGQTMFVPARFDNISKNQPEVTLLLPPALSYADERSIGSTGANVLNFLVMNDMHAGESTPPNPLWPNAIPDFGTPGWDDYDDGSKIGDAVRNDSLILDDLLGNSYYASDFIVALGDLTESSERSEFERTDKLLTTFVYKNGVLPKKCPWLPVIGNHDVWPYINSGEADWNSSLPRGQYFMDQMGAYYDSFHFWFPDARSQLFYTDGTHGYPPSAKPTYYFPAYFDLQGFRFIIGDFNSRYHAWAGAHGVIGSAELDQARLDTFTNVVREARAQKRQVVVLAHHPLNDWPYIPWNLHFSNTDRHKFAGDGEDLLRNYPVSMPVWIGGHVHPGTGTLPEEPVTDGNDVFCLAKTLLGACKDGQYGFFTVWDDVMDSLWHAPITQYPNVTFTATFKCFDASQSPAQYKLDFGDGSSIQTIGTSSPSLTFPTHAYPVLNHDCLYKATLTVITSLGRYVSVSDTVRIYPPASNLGPWTEWYPLPAGGGKKVGDGGCMAYDVYTNAIYASKGNKSNEFYKFTWDAQGGTWAPLQSIPLGTENKAAYYGSSICSDNQGNLYLTKGYNTRGFWQYNHQQNQWLQKCDVNVGGKVGFFHRLRAVRRPWLRFLA